MRNLNVWVHNVDTGILKQITGNSLKPPCISFYSFSLICSFNKHLQQCRVLKEFIRSQFAGRTEEGLINLEHR